MQLAARAAMLCAVLCVVGAFLPAGELAIRTPVSTHRRTASLYQLGASKDAAKTFLHRYRSSLGKKLGVKVLDKVAPRLRGRLGSGASDLQDAVATLDSIQDRDIDTVGAIIVAVLWSLLGVNLLVIALLWGVDATSRRLRIAAAVAVAVIAAILGIAVYLVLARIVSEANAEVERSVFALRGGAHMMLLAGLGLLIAAAITAIGYARTRARFRPPTPPPAPAP